MGCIYRHHYELNVRWSDSVQCWYFRMECLFCWLPVFHVLRGDGFWATLCWDLMSESETDSMFDGSSGGLDPNAVSALLQPWYISVSIECRYSNKRESPDPNAYDYSPCLTPALAPNATATASEESL
jgi:hypothetical protein